MNLLFYRLPEAAKQLDISEENILQLGAVGRIPIHILTGGFFVMPRIVAEIDNLQFRSQVSRSFRIKNNMVKVPACIIKEFVTGDRNVAVFLENQQFTYTGYEGEKKIGLYGTDIFDKEKLIKPTPEDYELLSSLSDEEVFRCVQEPVLLKDCELVIRTEDFETLQRQKATVSHTWRNPEREYEYDRRKAECTQWVQECNPDLQKLSVPEIHKELQSYSKKNKTNRNIWFIALSAFEKDFWGKYVKEMGIQKKRGPKPKSS